MSETVGQQKTQRLQVGPLDPSTTQEGVQGSRDNLSDTKDVHGGRQYDDSGYPNSCRDVHEAWKDDHRSFHRDGAQLDAQSERDISGGCLDVKLERHSEQPWNTVSSSGSIVAVGAIPEQKRTAPITYGGQTNQANISTSSISGRPCKLISRLNHKFSFFNLVC